MDLSFRTATDDDAPDIARVRVAVADDLTRRFGHGHWSAAATEKGVLRDIKSSVILLAGDAGGTVATLRLATKRPWAIDPEYFSPRDKVLYLTDMAVLPARQRRGIGRSCLLHARTLAVKWPADVIRLDAYDGPMGAGAFYAKCGFLERGHVTYRRTPLVYYELVLPGAF